MALSLPVDWEGAIGEGPAREACLAGIAEFWEGFALVSAPGFGAWCAAPTGSFCVEGVGAGCLLQDREPPVLEGMAGHLLAVGRGLGWAVRGMREPHAVRIENPLEANGYGFGCALLRTDATLQRGCRLPLGPAELDGFDEGLGRALWYVTAGRPRALTRLATGRSEAVWRGIGVASSFTGGLDETGLAELFRRSGPYLAAVEAGRGLGFAAREWE